MRRLHLLLPATLLLGGGAVGQVSYSGGVYSQNFDGLPGTTNNITNLTWSDNLTLPGWYSNKSTFNITDGTLGGTAAAFDQTEDTTHVGLFSFGAATSPDRALGSRASASAPGNAPVLYGVRLVNQTGRILTGFTVTYTGEQWFKSSAGNAHSLLLDYQFSAAGIAAGTWTPVPAATMAAPNPTGTTAAALDGNAATNRAVKVAAIRGVTWAPGQELWLRLRDENESSTEQGLAVDDFTFLADQESGLFFNGSTAHVSMGYGPASATAFGASDFTLECRMLRTGSGVNTLTGGGGVIAVPLIAKGVGEEDGSSKDANYFLGIDANGRLTADFEQRNATNNGTAYAAGQNFPIVGSTTLQYGTWYHVAATYQTSTATWKLYVNGIAESTTVPPGSPATFVGVVPRNDSIQGLGLGTTIDSTGATSGYFQGIIDEARIWNIARSQAQILACQNLNIVSGQAGMIARFGLDDAAGTTASGTTATGLPTPPGTLAGATLPVWVNAISVAAATPPVVTPTTPADEASGIGSSTTIGVNIADPENGATTVTFYGRKTTPLTPGPDFTLVALPDTQYYSESAFANPVAPGIGANISYFNSQTDWIRNNRDTRNIAFVSHMGDIVQNGDFAGNPVEWIRADGAMKTLEHQGTTLRAYGIPWGGAPGNHDLGTGDGTGTSNFYNQYFGTARFTGRSYYGGNFGTNNNNNYQFFSASGLDFMILHLEYNAGDLASYQAVLDWADSLMKAHPDRRAIVTSHYVLNVGNPATFGTQGQNIYNELKDNPNLFLILCGHIHGEGRRTDTYQSRDVHSILQNYQEADNGGNGFLRTLTFSPANNRITAEMYSPALNRPATASDVATTLGTFTLAYPMQSAVTDWIPLGTVNLPVNGTTATLNWTGLEAGSRYEWYASASDGTSAGIGATRRFATAPPVLPSVAITSPTDGANYPLPATIPLTANVVGQVARVEFYAGNSKLGQDSTAPYEFSWINPPAGVHLLSAVAVDTSGRASLSNIASITTGMAPTIVLTAPGNGATATAPATLHFAATAADSDGTVVKVEFYQGAFKVGEDSSSPYTFDWPDVAPGTYQLSAVATDDVGFSTSSAPVTSVVNAGLASGTVVRGPYLQKAASTEMTICWRGSQSAVGRVRYGTSLLNLNQFKDDSAAPPSPFNHTITLTGLSPGTTYYYTIGSASDTLAGGSDYTFTTPPLPGTVTDTRIWVLGDAGTATPSQTAVRDAFYTWTGARTPNLVLQLGDNAYNSGTDTNFTAGMFNIYPTLLRKAPFWSCLGNHETNQSTSFVDTYPYFSIYTFPTAGECGGTASGTEHYYAFNHGNIHFISLDSMTASRSATGAMATWLQSDLASTTATWIICFFHHPPYTKGSHNSDTENELIEMRQNILPILEAGGVDLVLGGHSHCYERSYLLDGHYGQSTTLTAAMKKNAGDGRPTGNGAYLKPLTGPRDHFGAVYAVAGSAGQATSWTGGSTATVNPTPHPAMFASLLSLGSLVLDVNGTRLDATFLRNNGSTPDTFTLVKQGAADSDADGIPDEYEISHGLNRFNPADAALDSDGDGVTNLKEFIFATASNVSDRYAFSTTYDRAAGTNTVTFPTVTGRNYRVMYSGTLLSWQAASPTISGTGATMQWTDDGTTTGAPPGVSPKRFYRIEVGVVP